MVFHDVADGKTLKFWEMYYRYYFADGTEPGKNAPKSTDSSQQSTASAGIFNTLLNSVTPVLNPSLSSMGRDLSSLSFTKKTPPVDNTNGNKREIVDIVSDKLDNHNFGFNLSTVQNVRDLIQSIDIYQTHGGYYNCVTIVNPRISAFTHDVLNYSSTDKTLELTFSVEYEYAYYKIQNTKLDTDQKQRFSHGEYLELPALAFNAQLLDFMDSNNPLLNSDNPILQRVGKNVQSTIGATTGAFLSNTTRKVSASVLNGLGNIPMPSLTPPTPPLPFAQPFASAAKSATSGNYLDMVRGK